MRFAVEHLNHIASSSRKSSKRFGMARVTSLKCQE
jgi:hypothetical protein